MHDIYGSNEASKLSCFDRSTKSILRKNYVLICIRPVIEAEHINTTPIQCHLRIKSNGRKVGREKWGESKASHLLCLCRSNSKWRKALSRFWFIDLCQPRRTAWTCRSLKLCQARIATSPLFKRPFLLQLDMEGMLS